MKIAIIGAGPRGLLIAEQLLKKIPLPEIHLFDPFGIGGANWQVDQSHNLVMNTPAQQIQLFKTALPFDRWCHDLATTFIHKNDNISDDLINDAQNIAPQSYAPRRLYGAYLKACFKNLSSHEKIIFHQTTVNSMDKHDDEITISFDGKLETFNDVILTINNGKNQLNRDENALAQYAKQNNLTYVEPINNISMIDFDSFKPHQDILIRGLGLTFTDIISELTQGRGGKYYRDQNDQLQYQPSGKEPHVIAGSLRGVPPYPKPIDQDGADIERKPIFLTIPKINQHINDHCDFYQAFQDMLSLEIEYRYYSNLIQQQKPEIDLQEFQATFIANEALPDMTMFKPAELFDWDHIQNPVAGVAITTVSDYQSKITSWLEKVTSDAKKGTQDSLIGSALNASRQLRNQIKRILAAKQDDPVFLKKFITEFVPTNTFLTSGAPCFRLEQLAALIRAKIVEIIPPQMRVIGANQSFVALSMFYQKERFKTTTLIEARMPKTNLFTTTNRLLQSGRQNKLLDNPQIKINNQLMQLTCVNTNHLYQAVINQNKPIPNLFIFGQLTEGQHWTTNICPRVGDDLSRQAAIEIANLI